eukprot:CAMPEP_0116913026 /NCGR_PEP_ID=MMETSP0467-20121206/16450_1 /TAXON_ID=283647 /ORGANISM="Mesodinium pulex, Strain SPMC105" /LENGTH=108 /DNA_ID=CAMNT_0004589145 /DNA_START=925 /DNA_END=1251 /DNA_ORIENTATION=+
MGKTKVDYSSNYDQTYNAKTGPIEKQSGFKELKEDLTKNHFDLGFQDIKSYTTENQSQFLDHKSPRESLTTKVPHDLRYKSFKLSEDNTFHKDTTNRSNYYDKSALNQ